jgi:aspartate/methionine/tyrosine aminotransferase
LLAADPTIAIIIVNSPNNPTGVVYPASLIAELARVIGKHPQVAVISDESYRTTIYSGTISSNLSECVRACTCALTSIAAQTTSRTAASRTISRSRRWSSAASPRS